MVLGELLNWSRSSIFMCELDCGVRLDVLLACATYEINISDLRRASWPWRNGASHLRCVP